jgi:hypothetical protein
MPETIRAYLSLQCLSSSLSSSEIMALIDSDTISRIKAVDPHPFFQAYSICHEGTSQPSILGDTARPIHWTRAAVQSIKNIILKGVKFFKGHNADNSTDKRESLGEIVASTEREIGGKLHHIAVGYFPNKEKVSDSDICSQEANWNLFEQAGHWFAGTIDKLTGIALSNSKVDKPAFADAKRLGMVQAFVLQGGGPGSGRKPEGGNSEVKSTVTLINVDDLNFRETEQNRKNTFDDDIMQDPDNWATPIVGINDSGNRSIIDGHNRAAYCKENGISEIPYTEISKKNYESLKSKGYDDMEIVSGILHYADTNRHSADHSFDIDTSFFDNQFPGSSLSEKGIEIEKYLNNNMQAFTAEEGDKNNKAGDAKMDLNTVPFSELVTEVKRRNTYPTQIFSLDEIKKDREILPILDKLEKLEKEITAKDKSLKDLEAEKTTLSKKIESVTAKDKLAEILTAKKLITVSDKQKVFIEKRFKGIEDLSDEGFKKYIESEINEYKAMVEILGAPTDEIVSNDDTTSATDATKAKNNPLLEEDFNANI